MPFFLDFDQISPIFKTKTVFRGTKLYSDYLPTLSRQITISLSFIEGECWPWRQQHQTHIEYVWLYRKCRWLWPGRWVWPPFSWSIKRLSFVGKSFSNDIKFGRNVRDILVFALNLSFRYVLLQLTLWCMELFNFFSFFFAIFGKKVPNQSVDQR